MGLAAITALTGFLVASGTLQAESTSKLSSALAATRPLSSLVFSETQTRFVPAKGAGVPDESVGDAGIALIFSQNYYWASNLWSSSGYTLTQGTLTDPEGRVGTIEAYRISPPSFSSDFQFIASGNDLFFRFPTQDDYVVYSMTRGGTFDGIADGKRIIRFRDAVVTEEAQILSNQIVVGGFTRIPEMNLHDVREYKVYFYLPKSTRFSSETTVSPGITSCLLSSNPLGRFSKFSINVSKMGIPYDSYRNQAGPGNAYMEDNQLLCFPDSDGSVSIFWKDTASKTLWKTSMRSDLSHTSVRMPRCLDFFGAATRDPDGNWYYITYNSGDSPEIMLVKTDAVGNLLKNRKLSPSADFMDTKSMSEVWNGARLHHAAGRLCLVLSRTMHNGHQGSTIAIFNSKTLATVNPPSQNASHSFDSRVVHDGRDFLAMSLGDNYPRGVVVNKVNDDYQAGKVVFTYRTRHALEPRDRGDGVILPAGRWSNDTLTYTELGDIVPMESGYGVLLASERSVSNELTTASVNQSRNLAYLRVAPDFDSMITDEYVVPEEMILTEGTDSRLFGFYDFGGNRVIQRNRNVVWLTNYRQKEIKNASRPKMIRISRNVMMILWEVWTLDRHSSTYGMTINSEGTRLMNPVDLDTVRLCPGDRMVHSGKHVFGVTSDGQRLEVTVIE